MKCLIVVFLLLPHIAAAQQYGWVQVAQIGNHFNTINCVEFKDSLHGWVGDGSTGFHYTTDGGVTWFDGPGATVNPLDISMIDTLRGWAAAGETQLGGVFRTTNGGRSWIELRYQFNRHYEGTSALGTLNDITSGYAVNFPDTGKIVQTTNGGTTWSERTMADSIGRLGKMQFVDSLHGWIIAGGGLLRTLDGGSNWTLLPTPRSFSAINFIDELRGWASSANYQGAIYRTADGGFSWTFQYCFCHPDTLLSVSAVSFIDTLNGWTFGTTIVGNFVGAIFRTTDGGWTWFREHVGLTRFINAGLMIDRQHGWAVGNNGVVLAYSPTTSVAEKLDEMPKVMTLRQNYPNPFNPWTSIEYEVMEQSAVRITVHDVNGRDVRQLIDTQQGPGVYRIRFDATGLASGAYYYTMKVLTKTKTVSETKQMIFLK